MIDKIVTNAPLFLLIAARCIALVFTLPLFSMRSTPRAAKLVVASYIAFFLMGEADLSSYKIALTGEGSFTVYYLLLLLGEALIGLLIGLYVSIIFSAFSTAGQLFAFQMGFSAASAYDSLSQVENPLMGQFLNLLAMLVFIENHWFQVFVIKGIVYSIQNFNVFDLIARRNDMMAFLLKGLTNLFFDAFVIALPIMGTLLFISVCTGLLSKAAPQMNLLSEGFPIMILLSFCILWAVSNDLFILFGQSFEDGISSLYMLFQKE